MFKNLIKPSGLILFILLIFSINSCKKEEKATLKPTSISAIGDSYQGGIVAYILRPGDPDYIPGQIHGLIAAPSDQTAILQWYVNGNRIPIVASATAIGTGNANTNNIVTNTGLGSYAAKKCYDLVLGDYSDWYLPSKDELNKLYLNKEVIGGFFNLYYWSSSQNTNDGSPWYQDFASGTQGYANANAYTNAYVRAVRAF